MDELERNSLEKQLEMARRNLNLLKEQAEGLGQFTPPYIKIGIEDGGKKVTELRRKLGLPIEDESTTQPITTETIQPTNPQVQTEPAETVSIQTPTSGEKPVRTKVFISYSHKDKEWLVKLKPHLEFLEKKGLLDRWDDTKIKAGMKWRDEIDKALAATKVAVLLVSADFLNSDFIQNKELPDILTAEGVTVLPVILRPCLYEYSEIKEFQWVSGPSKPLSGMSETAQEEVFVSLAKAIMEVLK